MNVEFLCPHCNKITDIFVEVESPSDYYPETVCEFCGRDIEDDKLDQKIMEEASEHFVGIAEYSEDR